MTGCWIGRNPVCGRRLLVHAVALALLALSAGCQDPAQPTVAAVRDTVEATIGGEVFELEVAADDASRRQGLSDRESIAEHGGMVFVFDRPRKLNFVMRRCLVPIDLIYLDPSGRIVSMHEMTVEPYDRMEWMLTRYESGWPAQFAVELRSGSIDRLGLEAGQKVDLPLEKLKQRAR